MLRDDCEYSGILFGPDAEEKLSYSEYGRYLERKARESNIPMFGQFELTPLCNLNCRMCYVHLTGQQLGDRPLRTVEEWKDLMRQAFDAGMMEAALTGGECLTYSGFEELYLYLQSLGILVTVMTNGLLVDEERIRFFRDHPPALVQITLYGCDEDSYERVTGQRVFGRVLENIRRLADEDYPLILSITPNRFLGEDVFETLRLARSITKNVIISRSLFVPEGESWRMRETDEPEAEYYARILRFDRGLQGKSIEEIPIGELPEPGGSGSGQESPDAGELPESGNPGCTECGLECGGGRSGFVIDWRGCLRICNRMENRAFPLRDGFEAAWREINEIANRWPRVSECAGCAYESVCIKCAAEFLKYAAPGEKPESYCRKTMYLISRGAMSFGRNSGS